MKSYYGEPSEYKSNEENVVLFSDENLKWKQVPANCMCRLTLNDLKS